MAVAGARPAGRNQRWSLSDAVAGRATRRAIEREEGGGRGCHEMRGTGAMDTERRGKRCEGNEARSGGARSPRAPPSPGNTSTDGEAQTKGQQRGRRRRGWQRGKYNVDTDDTTQLHGGSVGAAVRRRRRKRSSSTRRRTAAHDAAWGNERGETADGAEAAGNEATQRHDTQRRGPTDVRWQRRRSERRRPRGGLTDRQSGERREGEGSNKAPQQRRAH